MGNEILDMFRARLQQQTEQAVQEYLKQIDASKLAIYTGLNIEPLRQDIEGAMKAIGSAVHHFTDAHELLAKIQTSPPDLVIVQLGFNKMAGLSFVDLLGADPSTRMQPVLVITRLHSFVEFAPEDKDRCLGWYHNYIVECSFQEKVLGLLLYCARKRREAQSESPSITK